MPSIATAFLSKPHGEPEGAVHAQAEGLRAQFLVAGREDGRDERAEHGDAGRETDPAEGQVVGLLRVHALEDEVEEEFVHRGCPHTEGDTVSDVPLSGLLVAGRGQVFRVFLE